MSREGTVTPWDFDQLNKRQELAEGRRMWHPYGTLQMRLRRNAAWRARKRWRRERRR